jgi:hypothetical protein
MVDFPSQKYILYNFKLHVTKFTFSFWEFMTKLLTKVIKDLNNNPVIISDGGLDLIIWGS